MVVSIFFRKIRLMISGYRNTFQVISDITDFVNIYELCLSGHYGEDKQGNRTKKLRQLTTVKTLKRWVSMLEKEYHDYSCQALKSITMLF